MENGDPQEFLSFSEPDSMATRPVLAKKAPAKKAAAKKSASAIPKPEAAVVPVVTLKSVFEQLGETHNLTKKQALALLGDFVAAITTHLQSGARIRMSSLGILEVKDRPARTGRNPATGESIEIAASKKVAFRVAKELKAAV
jgi:DNA-binding protein HU-beta